MKTKSAKEIRSKKFKKTHFFTLLLGLFLFIPILFYGFIPLPTISDGYLITESRKVSHESPFKIQFNQRMNQASVEQYFAIEPAIEGKIKWLDGKTLTFQPTKKLTIGDQYTIFLSAKSKNFYLKELGVDLELPFVVSGPPFVKFVYPYQAEPKTNEAELSEAEPSEELVTISEDQIITVMFDRPIQSLEEIEKNDQQGFPQLSIQPPVEGRYRWMGTTAFQFIPKSWILGTTYELTLPKGVQSLDGGKTEEEIRWKLSTEALQVTASNPVHEEKIFPVDGLIRIEFNQPVDLDDVRPGDNVLLYPSNDVDANKQLRTDGFFNTQVVYGQDDKGLEDKKVLIFKPEFNYQYHQPYQLVLKSGLKALSSGDYGNRAMAEDFSIDFITTKDFEVIDFQPSNGDLKYKADHITIQFSSPVEASSILDRFTIDPMPLDRPIIEITEITLDDSQVWNADIYYSFEPSQTYTFELKTPLVDSLGNVLKSGIKATFKTAQKSAQLNWETSHQNSIFNEGVDPIFSLNTINIDRLDIRLCDLSETRFIELVQSGQLNQHRCPNGTGKTIRPSADLNQAYQVDLDLKNLYKQDFDSGIYFLEASSPDYLNENEEIYRLHQTFQVSDTHLTLKKSQQGLIIWATDLKSGEPVSRLDIKILSVNGEELQRGVTDGNGIYRIRKPFNEPIYVSGSKSIQGESRRAFVSELWAENAHRWDYNSDYNEWVSFNEPKIYLYSDKDNYQPNETLFFKGFYRFDQDAQLLLSPQAKLKISIEDEEANLIDTQTISILTDGSFSGSFELSEKTALGHYNLYAESLDQNYLGQRFYYHFSVNEFKQNPFKVELFMREASEGLSPVEFEINSDYFFGGAVADANVRWNLSYEPYFHHQKGEFTHLFSRWIDPDCSWRQCELNTKKQAQGSGQLNEKGQFTIRIPDEISAPSTSSTYHLQIEVENKKGQQVFYEKSFVFHEASYYIGLRTDRFFYTMGDDLNFKVMAVSSENENLVDKKIELELFYESSESAQAKWTSVKKKSVVTADKEVEVAFESPSKGGTYLLRAVSAEGSTSELKIYVASSEPINWGHFNDNEIKLIPDHLDYFPGGKARILMQTPYGSKEQPIKALITYERGDIQSYQVIEVTSNSQWIEVPIDENMVPNVYINAMMIKGPGKKLDEFIQLQQARQLKKNQASLGNDIQNLKSELETLKNTEVSELSSRDEILIAKKERELADLTAQLGDESNSPPSDSEVTSSALSFEDIKPVVSFGATVLNVSRREHEIFVDIDTNEADYKAGEPIEIEIHTLDYQSRPIQALVSLSVVENALKKSLTPTVNPLAYFYKPRTLQVATATAFESNQFNDHLLVGENEITNSAIIDFKSTPSAPLKTVYFDPLVQTDQGGYAKVTFKPSSDVMNWRVTAIASNGAKKFGLNEKEFEIKNALTLTPLWPDFLMSEDDLTLSAFVENHSDEMIESKFELISDDLIIGSQSKSIQLMPGSSYQIDFPVKVKSVSKDKMITIQLKGSELDFSQELLVKSFAYPEKKSMAYWVDDTSVEKIRLSNQELLEMSYLDLNIGWNLLSFFNQELNDLIASDDFSADFMVSQLLPILSLENKLNKQQIDLFSVFNLNHETLKATAQEKLKALSLFQRFDGGYASWKQADSSDPLLTAMVLYVQSIARNNDFLINENRFNQAIQFLWTQLGSKPSIGPSKIISENHQAFMLWILSELGQPDTRSTLALYEDREHLSLSSQAYLLMNLVNLYDAGQLSVSPFIDRLKSEILDLKITKGNQVYFQSDNATERMTTALILMSFKRDNPNNPVIANLINYLIASHSKSYFLNTHESAWVLASIIDYYQSEIEEADFSFKVLLNDKEQFSGQLDASNSPQIFNQSVVLSDLKLNQSLNQFDFTKEGEGQMSVDLDFTYYTPNQSLSALEKGFHLTRDYYYFDGLRQDLVAKTFNVGKLYKGQLNLIVPEDSEHVIVEEFIPAGFELIDFEYQSNDSIFDHMERSNGRLLLFANHLKKGVYSYDFLVKAKAIGNYHHLPASAHLFYSPQVMGRTNGELVEIRK